MKPWGGKRGLKKRRESDEKKKALCKKLNYRLVESSFDEEITLEAAGRKLRRFIKLKEWLTNAKTLAKVLNVGYKIFL